MDIKTTPRVLLVSSQLHDENVVSKGNITGLAIILNDIFHKCQNRINCYFFLTGSHLKGDNNRIYTFTKFNKYMHALHFYMLYKLIRGILCGESLHEIKNEIKRCIELKEMKAILKTISPDIINFHDLDDSNKELIRYCHKEKYRCIVTIHLYMGKTGDSSEYRKLQKNENDIFTLNGLFYSVVSTGMKKRILTDYPKIPSDHIYVIVNSSNIKYSQTIPHNLNLSVGMKKILLCIGRICERKNQMQIVRVVSTMSKQNRKDFEIWFIGEDKDSVLQNNISAYGVQDTLKCIGKIPFDEMGKYYQSAFGTISVSKNEGFGLTILEGYSYGLPALFFEDIDSYPDIYDPHICLAVKDRSDICLGEAIIRFINTFWDTHKIKSFSSRFSMDAVADRYVEMYQDVFNRSERID